MATVELIPVCRYLYTIFLAAGWCRGRQPLGEGGGCLSSTL